MRTTLWDELCLRSGCLGMAAVFFFLPTVLSQMESNTRVKCLARPCLTFQAQINKRWPLRLFCSRRASHERDTDEVNGVHLSDTDTSDQMNFTGRFFGIAQLQDWFHQIYACISREQCSRGSWFTFPAPFCYNLTPPHMDACFWIHVS